jgi:hypothetical protein
LKLNLSKTRKANGRKISLTYQQELDFASPPFCTSF